MKQGYVIDVVADKDNTDNKQSPGPTADGQALENAHPEAVTHGATICRSMRGLMGS
jgi:hypothetical protein